MSRRRVGVVFAGLLALGATAAIADTAPQRPSLRPAPPEAGASPYAAAIAQAKSTMMTAPEQALAHAQRAAALSTPGSLDGLTAVWLEGEALYRARKASEALAILDTAVAPVSRLAPDSKLLGNVLKARGQANGALGHVQNALADYQNSYEIFRRAKEPRLEALALQAIAAVYQQAGDDEHALRYYTQSAEAYSLDPRLSLALHNNRGMVLLDLGRLPEAHAEFASALSLADSLNSDNLRAQVLTNLANTEVASHNYAQARRTVGQGLALTQRDDEAAGERPFLLGVAAKAALAAGDPGQAVRLLNGVFHGVDLGRTPAEYRDIHETAAQAYEALGEPSAALAHQKALKRLDDLSRSLSASASAALVAARFDFANQDLRISRLKQGQLERDIRLARSQDKLRNVIIFALSFGGLIVTGVGLGGFLYMRWSRDNIRSGRDQLAIANQHLEKALNAKTEFLAMASHEMRTPLNGILGVTQVILHGDRLQEDMRRRISLVQSAGETMKSLVDDLLDVAKSENAAITLECEPFPLRATIKDACKFWEDKATAKHLKLSASVDVQEQAIGDQVRLKQIISNLLSNAIKFTDAGGVILDASYVAGELVVTVSDTGVGIGAEDHGRIFEAFTQVDSGKARRFAGTGLGLSICRKIAQAMGGRIGVESVLGEGACFTLTVPLQLASAEPQAGHGEAPALLILDANPLNCAILKAGLVSQIGSVECARSLADAVGEWRAARLDLILADVAALGSEEGWSEAVAQLGRCWPDANVTLITAASHQAIVEKLTTSQVDMLIKPVGVPAIAHHLNSRRTNNLDTPRKAA